jgi:dTDP-4-amino-4,6-dideoxygalactose transaminase
MNVPLCDIQTQYRALESQLQEAVNRVLKSGQVIGGPEVSGLEEETARYCGTDYGVGCSSGSDALLVALSALGVGPGDEVITVPNTYIATAFAITYTGALPVFVDVDPVTLNMDPAAIGPALTSRTKSILPVHMYGQAADIDAIRQAAPGISVVEDAAHAHGATLGDRHAGSLGDLAAFSFYPSKVLGALGDGGAITASTPELEARGHDDRMAATRQVVDGASHQLALPQHLAHVPAGAPQIQNTRSWSHHFERERMRAQIVDLRPVVRVVYCDRLAVEPAVVEEAHPLTPRSQDGLYYV